MSSKMPFSCAQLSSRKLPALPEMTSIALHGRNQMCECEILDQTEVKTRAGNNNTTKAPTLLLKRLVTLFHRPLCFQR